MLNGNHVVHLALVLDGPMQSWGCSSRFTRRTTASYPTKSALIGLLAAAMGIDKYASSERTQIQELAALELIFFILPKHNKWHQDLHSIRLKDFHTVEKTKTANGTNDKNAVISDREYLLDARFGVILVGDGKKLTQIAKAIQNPQWGVWFGRKCCIPATPLFVAIEENFSSVWTMLLNRTGFDPNLSPDHFTCIKEHTKFSHGALLDTIRDHPTTFSRPNAHQHRRISITIPSK